MPPFIWKPEYGVNIDVIDEQHKQLIEAINTLNDAMTAGKGKTVLNEIFNTLINYTTTHFTTEENLMIAHSYPQYTEHKEAHEKFISRLLELKSRFDKGDLSVTLALNEFVIDWLQHHIFGMDKKYVRFFRGKGL